MYCVDAYKKKIVHIDHVNISIYMYIYIYTPSHLHRLCTMRMHTKRKKTLCNFFSHQLKCHISVYHMDFKTIHHENDRKKLLHTRFLLIKYTHSILSFLSLTVIDVSCMVWKRIHFQLKKRMQKFGEDPKFFFHAYRFVFFTSFSCILYRIYIYICKYLYM